MKNLQTSLKGGLTIKSIMETSEDEILRLIYPVGFYNKKAVFLKKIAKILHEEYADDIPGTFEKIVELPGVGPKMANIAMNVAWNK